MSTPSKQRVPKEHECAHVLIVEGYSDLHFYAAFLRHLGRLEGVYFQVFEGKSNILSRETLADFINEKRLTEKCSIGILLDADRNPTGAGQSMVDHLLAITGRSVVEGEWHEREGQARLGFFVAPDLQTEGEVETLAWNSLPADEKHSAMKSAVRSYLDQMETLGWKTKSPDKGRVSAYLAAAYDEDPRLGPGAREGKFPFETPGFDRLRRFLSVLPARGNSGTSSSA